ncbi:MFS transporter [Amedibacillus sp. YH-ame10]
MKQGYRIIFKQKLFMRSIFANLINRFGDSVDAIAFSWLVYAITNSAAWSAIVLGVNLLPNIVVQPIAGAIVERLSKKRVIVVCDIARGIMTAFILILYLGNNLSPWVLLGITFINNTFEAFRSPATTCFLPLILKEEYYEFGLSFNQSSSRICELVGLGLAGVIIATFGIQGAIIIDMLTFFFCAAIISGVPVKEEIQKTTSTVLKNIKVCISDLKDGLRYLVKSRILFTICMIACILNMALVPINSFQAPYINGTLNAPAYVLSMMSMGMSIGIAIGAFLYPYIHKVISNRMILLGGGVAIGIYYITLTGISLLSSLILVMISIVIINVIFGIFLGAMIAMNGVVLMENVEKSYLARASAIYGALAILGMPILSFIMSGISNYVDVPTIFTSFGVFTILIFIGMMFVKSIKDI